MNKAFLLNTLKYALALALLVAVVWLNWGSKDRVAAKVVAGTAPSEQETESDTPTITGRIVALQEGRSVTVEAPAGSGPGRRAEFALVDKEGVIPLPKFLQASKKTVIQLPEGVPALAEGMTVAVWEAPRGLAYVWQRHLVEGEPVQWHYFFLAIALCLGSVLLTLVRWFVLVRAQGLPFTLSDAMRLGLVGYFFNTFLPGSVGGDLVKATFLGKEQGRHAVAWATVIFDRAIALWGLVCFVAGLGSVFWAAGLIASPVSVRIVQIAIAVVVVTLALWAVMGLLPEHRAQRFAGRLARVPKVGRAAAEFWRAAWLYRCQRGSIALALVLSWVGHVGFVLTFYFAVLTLWDAADAGQKIPSLPEHFLLVPIGLVIGAVGFLPGGAGIGELGFGGLYRLFGCAASSGVLGSLVQRVVSWVVGAFGYLVYLRMRPALRQAVADAAETASPAASVAAPASQAVTP